MKFLKITSFLALAMVLIFSCSKEQTNTKEGQASDKRAGEKVDICHYSEDDGTWHKISVSVNALPAHLAHGDVILVDADGDGWVAAENECVPGGDCNDNDPAVNPGVEEICENEVDDNCDGNVSEGCCPLYTYAEVSAISGQITCHFLPCCGDQWGFCWSGGCNFGVDADEFWGVSPGCGAIFSLTSQEVSACKTIILQVADDLGISYLKPDGSVNEAIKTGMEGLSAPANK